ncbi:MAG: hypothetical protein CMJ82_13370 [Planctomycetaceae bacterium]|nr:hypothetical protein [Planctomycetaceae bacterium]
MLRYLASLAFILTILHCRWILAEQPIATIAIISNPYITTLPPEEIKDERGSVRDFLAKTSPAAFANAIKLINQLQPDATVIQGSLTWSGSAADFAKVREYVDQINVPVYTMPGHRDRLQGALEPYRKALSDFDVDKSTQPINGTLLVFASDLHGNPEVATARIQTQLSNVSNPKAVLLFGDRDGEFKRSNLTPDYKPFNELVNTFNIAMRFDPIRYGYRVHCENTLPVRSIGSLSWSERNSVALARVYNDRIDVAQVSDPEQPAYSLVVPNPVTQDRLPLVDDDPYKCPSYTQDRAASPDLTFALISDPQFDRKVNRDLLIQRATAGIAELNLFEPDVVCVSGDLVNNNLPEEWKLFRQYFDTIKSPLELVAGNHDVLFNYNFVEALYADAPKQSPDYARLVAEAVDDAEQDGFSGPTALFQKFTGRKPNYIAEYGETAFIMVSFMTQRADESQIRFLRDALEKTKSKNHVFVVAHYPSIPTYGYNLQPQLGGDEVLSLLHQYRVTGYLFGHRHFNGFQMHDRTAHVLSDNMRSIHFFHVHRDRVTIGRKQIGAPLYERLTIPATRSGGK